jgi:hypothetical protein
MTAAPPNKPSKINPQLGQLLARVIEFSANNGEHTEEERQAKFRGAQRLREMSEANRFETDALETLG